ncbi:hypothetical protein [Nocardioides kribbensis]|uniref:hypothetical protein n=1 Tax=Nocardioides kribbensis TaxID=305517 RepID=UPI0032D9E8E7
MTTPASVENPHAGQGSVLLDIGGDVGALVVTMPASMLDVEVEIKPVGADFDEPADHPHDHGHGHGHGHGRHPHVAVVARPVPGGGSVPSLVYPDLVGGSYDLYVKDTTDIVLTVEVPGGSVATAEWPGA